MQKMRMKTKTVVDALQSLRLIPSFSTSNFGGDVLPEATLLKNILEEMMVSMTTLSVIVDSLESPETANVLIKSSSGKIKPQLEILKQVLAAQRKKLPAKGEELAIQVEDYDADTEGEERVQQRRERRLRRREKIRSESSGLSATAPIIDGVQQEEEDVIIRTSRDILLAIQNDPVLERGISQWLPGLDEKGRDTLLPFIQALDEMAEYSVASVILPYENYLTDVESLCGSIFMSQKLQKTIKKMRASLTEIDDDRRKMIEEKKKAKCELVDAEKIIRKNITEMITDMHTVVDNKIKVLAWNSHARQIKLLESCTGLRREYEENIKDHVTTETNLRHSGLKLESEISDMIAKFDEEMFCRHREIDRIEAEYAQEKMDLFEARELLEATEANKARIIDQKRKQEEEERNEQLMGIRKNVAAKVIQRAWRSHKARILLKSKKKRKKK